MIRRTMPDAIWTLGVDEVESAAVHEALSEHYSIVSIPVVDMQAKLQAMESVPVVVVCPVRIWNSLDDEVKTHAVRRSQTPLLLLADGSDMDNLYHDKGIGDFTSLLNLPLEPQAIYTETEKLITEKRRCALLQQDQRRRHRETDDYVKQTLRLQVLNELLTQAVESMNPAVILASMELQLNNFLPKGRLHGIFFPFESEPHRGRIFLSGNIDTEIREQWSLFLRQKVLETLDLAVCESQIRYHSNHKEHSSSPAPRHGCVYFAPLQCKEQIIGVLAYSLEVECTVSREQIEVLSLIAKGMSPALLSAFMFEKAHHEAEYDDLTGLYNRNHFNKILNGEICLTGDMQQHVSILMVDMDHFKKVNDTYGHAAGDAVLREIGRLLHHSVRSDDYTARYGGEEFVVILREAGLEQAEILAHRLRETIAEKVFYFEEHAFQVTASIGVASFSIDARATVTEMLGKADKALYQAKNLGRNAVFSACMDTNEIQGDSALNFQEATQVGT